MELAKLSYPQIVVNNPILSSFTRGHKTNEYIAQQLCQGPVADSLIPVNLKTGTYRALRDEALVKGGKLTYVAAGTPVERSTFGLDAINFELRDYGWGVPIDQEMIDQAAMAAQASQGNQGQLNLEQMAAGQAAEKVRLQAEIDAAAIFFSSSYVTQTQALSAKSTIFYPFSDATNSDPMKILSYGCKEVQRVCGKYPNVVVMNATTEFYIANNPQWYNKRINVVAVDNLFRLPDYILGISPANAVKILRGQASYLSTENATSMTDVWGDNLLLAYVEPPGPAWNSLTAGFEKIGSWKAWSYLEQQTRVIECEQFWTAGFAINQVKAGFLFTAVTAA